MAKIKLLARLAQEIRKCKECKKGKQGLPVPGEGNPDADIIFIGEAPGREEATTGRPFVGRSGKFLTQLQSSIGLKREDVFITSPVKYLPRSGTPTNSDIDHGRVHLLKQIKIIAPKLIVLLGNVAAKALLSNSAKITQNHGKVIKENNRTYFLTFHPAAAIRFPKIKSEMIEDFKKLKFIIDKNMK